MDIMLVCFDDDNDDNNDDDYIVVFVRLLGFSSPHRSWPECSPHVSRGEFAKETQRFPDSHQLNLHRFWESNWSNNWHQVRSECWHFKT